MLYRFNIHRSCADHITLLNVSQFNNSLVFWVKGWLIQYADTQVFLGAVGLRHFQESIYFTDRRYVFGNEWLQLSIEVYLLRLVSLDVLEQFLDL